MTTLDLAALRETTHERKYPYHYSPDLMIQLLDRLEAAERDKAELIAEGYAKGLEKARAVATEYWQEGRGADGMLKALQDLEKVNGS